MLAPAKPANEPSRLAALRDLHILDTSPEERFDRITRIAAKLFDVPIALVSLVDENRQWFKSRQGLDAEQTDRDISFCGHAILQSEVFVIEDALADSRFSDNPLVMGQPLVRFYAGAPLSGDNGVKLGTLCIVGRESRHFSDRDRALLRGLAAWAERELTVASEYQAVAIRLENKLRLAAILEHLVEGVITTDSSGNIESVNSVVTQIFGYSQDELAGTSIALLIPPAQHAGHDGTYMARLRAAPIPLPRHNFEATGVRKDGSELPLDVSFSDLVISGKRLFVGIVRDITERKEIERFKNELVATINHELRTPITAIIGALGLLRNNGTGLTKDMAMLLDMAYQNSERLSTLIDDFLDLEQIASGNMKFHLRPFDIAPFLEKAVSINAAYAEKFGVRFELSQPPQAKVQADADRLMQVITNLMSNAAKFSPKGSAIGIAAEVRGPMLRVSVHDQGPGIPPEFRDRVFERFAQAGSPGKRQKGSSGLGLSICKAIIEKMNGSIGFDSPPGQGTTFYFELLAG